MSSANLLALPREIRSIIYSHLSQPIAFDWGWCMCPFPVGGHDLVRLSVPEAPLPSVLLSCRQIYHEYSQERQFRKSVLTVSLHENVRMLPEGKATNHERVAQILQRVHKANIVVPRTPHVSPETTWKRGRRLTKMIEAMAPRLEFMGMIVRTPVTPMPLNLSMVNMLSGAIPHVELGPAAFVGALRALVEQDYDHVTSTTSAYTACQDYADDVVVGEWHLHRDRVSRTIFRMLK